MVQKHARWRRFLAAEQPISDERVRLTKILAQIRKCRIRTKDDFKRNLNLETPRATVRKTIWMVRVTDETYECFRNESFVN